MYRNLIVGVLTQQAGLLALYRESDHDRGIGLFVMAHLMTSITFSKGRGRRAAAQLFMNSALRTNGCACASSPPTWKEGRLLRRCLTSTTRPSRVSSPR